MPLNRISVALITAMTAAMLAVSCSSSSTSAATTSDPVITNTTASTTTEPATPPGCSGGSAPAPAGAVSREIVDVDGDGKPDTAWISNNSTGAVTVGIVTSAGGGTQRTWESASPVTRSLLVATINDATPPLLLADDGRTVQLWAFANCTIADVRNQQDQPYTFSLGFTDYGTGVGCAEVDGRNELVGLNITDTSAAGVVTWTSTVVAVSGTKGLNGAITDGTYSSPADDAQIELLSSVSCGNATMAKDGLTLAQ